MNPDLREAHRRMRLAIGDLRRVMSATGQEDALWEALEAESDEPLQELMADHAVEMSEHAEGRRQRHFVDEVFSLMARRHDLDATTVTVIRSLSRIGDAVAVEGFLDRYDAGEVEIDLWYEWSCIYRSVRCYLSDAQIRLVFTRMCYFVLTDDFLRRVRDMVYHDTRAEREDTDGD